MKNLKPSSKLPKPAQMLEYQRSDRVGVNPNSTNRYGSTNVTWDGDQATITQTLSPDVQALTDQQIQLLGQGPAQLGSYSNPTLENMFAGFANRVSGRAGMPNMGGQLSTLPSIQQYPQMGPQQMGPQQTLPPNQVLPQPNQSTQPPNMAFRWEDLVRRPNMVYQEK